MVNIDKNHDGIVTGEEALAYGAKLNSAKEYLDTKKVMPSAETEMLRQQFDIDGNGKIDKQEKALVQEQSKLFDGLLAKHGFKAGQSFAVKDFGDKVTEVAMQQGGVAKETNLVASR